MADEATPDATQDGQTQQYTPQDGPKMVPQDQVDRIIKDRLERQRQQYEPKLAGLDELKAKAAKLDELEASRQTEAEKLLSAIDKANKQAQEASEREKAATERANTTLIRAAVISEAATQRAVNPQAVYALLNDSQHKQQIQLGDDDRVEGVPGAVKALLEEHSYLVGNRPNGGFDGGPRQTAPAQSSNADLNDAIRRQAGFA